MASQVFGRSLISINNIITYTGPGIPRIDAMFLDKPELDELFTNNLNYALSKAPKHWVPTPKAGIHENVHQN